MELNQQHYQAIFLLVTGRTAKQAALELELNAHTITRWKQDPDFNLALQEAHSRVYDDAINKLTTIAGKCAEYLELVMDDPDVPTRTKLQAISIVLTHGAKAREYNMNRRLEKLERLALNQIENVEDIEVNEDNEIEIG